MTVLNVCKLTKNKTKQKTAFVMSAVGYRETIRSSQFFFFTL